MLIIGFTLGQIQLVEPMLKEYNKLFNEEVPHLCIFRDFQLSVSV